MLERWFVQSHPERSLQVILRIDAKCAVQREGTLRVGDRIVAVNSHSVRYRRTRSDRESFLRAGRKI